MYDYQENYSRLTADRERAVYEKLLAQYDALLVASIEGVFEITVRSQSGAIVVPVFMNKGIGFTNDLIEYFSERIDRVERNLNTTLKEIGEEAKHAKSTSEMLEEIRQQNKTDFAQQYAIQQAQLASQAAATAAPVQKGPGRPRRAAIPRPGAMEAAGAMAAQVPMNGSTGQAVGRAVNSPQG